MGNGSFTNLGFLTLGLVVCIGVTVLGLAGSSGSESDDVSWPDDVEPEDESLKLPGEFPNFLGESSEDFSQGTSFRSSHNQSRIAPAN